MGENGLYALYRLHQVDSALLDMKRRAAALDGGKALKEAMDRFKAENAKTLEEVSNLETRIKGLEDRVQLNNEKIKQLDKTLYGGSVVNTKEAAGYEAEIKQLKTAVANAESELLQCMEELPAAQVAAGPVAEKVQQYLLAIKKKNAQDVAEGASLQASYKEQSAERAKRAAEVPKPLLAQYEAIRTKYLGVGISVLKGGTCGACGTNLPTKVVQSLDSDRLVTCESCHRILFKVVAGDES